MTTDLRTDWADRESFHGDDLNVVTDHINDLVAGFSTQSTAKLVAIGNQGNVAMSTAASTSGTSEVMTTVGIAATGISALFTHWLTTALVDTDPGGGAIVFNAALKVVSTTAAGTVVGSVYRLTFGGRTTATLDPGGKITADILGISLAPGDVVAIRTFLVSGTAYSPRIVYGASVGGMGGFIAASDLTGANTAITGTTGSYFGPSALLGIADSNAGRAKSVFLIADSLAGGGGDTASITNLLMATGGFVQRALTGVGGMLNAAMAAGLGTAVNFQSSDNSFRRMGVSQFCTSAILGYGTNELWTAGATAASIEAIHLDIANKVRRQGISRVFLITIYPHTTSTDGWITAANQTVFAGEAQRVLYNTWVRAGAPIDPITKAAVAVGTVGALLAGSLGHPITGWFDTASAVESSLNSGKWAPALRVATGSMTSGGNVITSSTANFVNTNQEVGGDKGTYISLAGAGASGGYFTFPAAVVVSATQIAFAFVASATVVNTVLGIGLMTADGFNPSGRGHYAMAQMIDTAQL